MISKRVNISLLFSARPVCIALFLLIGTGSCVKPFNPPPSSRNLNYLVVDGMLVPGAASTIKLSRTLNISDTFHFVAEKNARVYIQSESGNEIECEQSTDGIYTAHAAFVSPAEKARLKIIVQGGDEYVSDYVEVKQSPPIDSITWRQDDDIFISVNTHDDKGASRYYRWEYEETIEYKSVREGHLDFVNGEIVSLDPADSRYRCYKFNNSTNILLGSSVSLTEDVIRHALITTIPNDNSKISTRYSILVRQSVLSPEAYKYWQLLRQNTETNGNIFDPQPSQLRGNIRNVKDPGEVVIGYVSASSKEEKRIFIEAAELPEQIFPAYDPICDLIQQSTASAITILSDPEKKMLPVDYVGAFVMIAPAECVDCRLHGGTNHKPTYW